MAVFKCDDCEYFRDDLPASNIGKRAVCPRCGMKHVVVVSEAVPTGPPVLISESPVLPPHRTKHTGVVVCYLILAVALALGLLVYVGTMFFAIHDRTMTAYSAVFLAVFGGVYMLVRCIDNALS